MSATSAPELPAGLRELVEAHLRASLMLLSVSRAEECALAEILAALQGVPDHMHEALMSRCIEEVAGQLLEEL